jgi:hypothetical protein
MPFHDIISVDTDIIFASGGIYARAIFLLAQKCTCEIISLRGNL